MLPPGAFIGLGMMLAIKYLIDERTKKRRAATVAAKLPTRCPGRPDEQNKATEILTRLRDDNPHPTTELNFHSFELLIAVLLSAQATDVSVNKATALLYPVANTPHAMLELGVEGVKSISRPLVCLTAKRKTSLRPAVFWWKNTAARCRKIVRRWKRYRVSGGKRLMWY
jgi:hypothetical protein